jgi:hypothetical protein
MLREVVRKGVLKWWELKHSEARDNMINTGSSFGTNNLTYFNILGMHGHEAGCLTSCHFSCCPWNMPSLYTVHIPSDDHCVLLAADLLMCVCACACVCKRIYKIKTSTCPGPDGIPRTHIAARGLYSLLAKLSNFNSGGYPAFETTRWATAQTRLPFA